VARRRDTAPQGEPAGQVPAELARFVYEDWADREDQTPPEWWANDADTWRLLGARRRWMDACRAWRDEHGVTSAEWAVLRGVCGPGSGCDRTYPHAHS
jgi:hypothetical protein